MNKVEILLDKRANNLSLVTIDDTTKESVETTLSVAEAWNLVAELNEGIQKLTLSSETRVQVTPGTKLKPEDINLFQQVMEHASTAHVNIDARGSNNPERVEAVVRRSLSAAAPYTKTNAVATTPVPKSAHRPFSGTMNT